MSKFKFSLILLGVLLTANTNLHAEEAVNAEKPVSREEAVAIENENPAQTEAAEPEQPVTQADIDGVRGELAVLTDKLNRQLVKNVPSTTRSLKIGGSLQNRYTAVTKTNKAGEYKSGFSLNSTGITLKGNLKTDYDEGRNIDYSAGFSASPTGTSATTAYLTPTDAYIQYSILSARDVENPLLYIQLGQQKRLFGLDAATTEELQPVISGATFSGAKGLNLSARDVGVQLRGDLFPHVDLAYNYRIPLIEYYFGLYNGSGANIVDTNRGKDILGRLVLHAPVDYLSPYKGLTIGSSFYSAAKQETTNTGLLKDKFSKIRWGQDISYLSTPIGFTAEYAVGRDENFSDQTAKAVKVSTPSKGYTLTLFYSFGEQFLPSYKNQSRSDDWWPKTYEPFVRFDRWDPNTNITGNETTIVTYGFNIYFAETTKLQLNYLVRDEKGTKLKQNDFIAQFQYGF
jgi:hypothetical protein